MYGNGPAMDEETWAVEEQACKEKAQEILTILGVESAKKIKLANERKMLCEKMRGKRTELIALKLNKSDEAHKIQELQKELRQLVHLFYSKVTHINEINELKAVIT